MGAHSRKRLQDGVDQPLLPVAEKQELDDDKKHRCRPAREHAGRVGAALALLTLFIFLYAPTGFDFPFPRPEAPVPPFVKEGIEQCKLIHRPNPHFSPSIHRSNERFVKGTKSVLLKNGTIWTGGDDGNEVLYGHSVLLEAGVVSKVGSKADLKALIKDKDVEEVELNGAWVTPGIVDMHSHLGVDPAPGLRGGDDTNSLKGSIQPWLRSLDGLHITDAAFNSTIAGGITTALVLPGSANAIGGQAFPIKTRWTRENTPESMLVEPAFVSQNGSWKRTHAWRHIKHACGENPSRVYGNTRLDTAYDFRRAYNEGKKLKDEQERWCASPKTQTEPFPASLEWEVLSDVIRGNVKVNIHCYETVDFNDLVRISNEFQFPIAAFHHAHEAYLVPDLLKSAYGPVPPTVAIFATNARYKRESYRGSEFAAKILADAGLNVAMKSDHPVLDSRYLVYEAAQAHHYGLNFSQALGSVTTHPARALGLDHRVGYLKEGFDADVVVWDSFPLSLGATPKQTYIDGIPQIVKPHVIEKPTAAQEISKPGHYDDEAKEAIAARGEPDLWPKKTSKNVIFQDVSGFYLPGHVGKMDFGNATVVVKDGAIACVGECAVEEGIEFEVIDLKGGSFAPGLISVGSYMGLMDIRQEKSTWDGVAYDPLSDSSDLLDGLLVHGVDGAEFGSRDELLAYRSGVTAAVAYPISSSLFSGLSYSYSTSARQALAPGAILNPAAALHIALTSSKQSVSTKLAVLRRLLQEGQEEGSEIVREVIAAKRGERRLVVEANKADVIAAVIRLKRDVAPGLRITILGGAEAWLVADELATEDIGVIVAPARSFPHDWNERRIIPGPPLSHHTLPSYLAARGVKVGLGITEEWEARNTRYDAAWVYANGGFSKQAALDLVSSNLEELLGLDLRENSAEKGWVAYEGDVFSLQSRVRAAVAPRSETVDLF